MKKQLWQLNRANMLCKWLTSLPPRTSQAAAEPARRKRNILAKVAIAAPHPGPPLCGGKATCSHLRAMADTTSSTRVLKASNSTWSPPRLSSPD